MQCYTCDGESVQPGIRLEARHDDEAPSWIRLGSAGPGRRPCWIDVRAPPDGSGRLAATTLRTVGKAGRLVLGAPDPREPKARHSVLVALRVPCTGDHTILTAPTRHDVPCPERARPLATPVCEICHTPADAGHHPPTGTFRAWQPLEAAPHVTVLGRGFRPPAGLPGGYRANPRLDPGHAEALVQLDRGACLRVRPSPPGFLLPPTGLLTWDGRYLGLQMSLDWEE